MSNLPKISDLYNDISTFSKEEQVFSALLNEEPNSEWIRTHPFICNYKYLPINRIEFLLKAIFLAYKIEITGQGTAFNGVWVSVRVHYRHPISGEWLYHDGIGAAQLQTAKGTSPAELQNINNGAISMAFPIAKTVAIKDACDHFGRLFGSDLNRKDIIPYEKPEKIVPFERGHKVWDKAVDSVKKGQVTIEQIKSKYNLTVKGEQQLKEDAGI